MFGWRGGFGGEAGGGGERGFGKAEEEGEKEEKGSFAQMMRQLTSVLQDVKDAMEELMETMEVSEADGLLDYDECERLLGELEKREEEIEMCLEEMRRRVAEVQRWVREICLVAVAFLEEGKLRRELGIVEVLEFLEELGDEVGGYDFSERAFPLVVGGEEDSE